MPQYITIACEECGNSCKKLVQYVNENKKLNQKNYCSKKCANAAKKSSLQVNCANCGCIKSVIQSVYNRSKTKRFFCDKSCAAQYNNKNKNYGTRRSKLEEYFEEQLLTDFPQLTFLFNDKRVIGSELDVYCPELRLAIEINGIVHYEPIYGADTFDRIKDNDKQKMLACEKEGVELIIVNAADHSYVTTKTCKTYYKPVRNLIVSIVPRSQVY